MLMLDQATAVEMDQATAGLAPMFPQHAIVPSSSPGTKFVFDLFCSSSETCHCPDSGASGWSMSKSGWSIFLWLLTRVISRV